MRAYAAATATTASYSTVLEAANTGRGREARQDDSDRSPGRALLPLAAGCGGAVDDSDVRHLRWLRDRLGPQLADAAVITTGELAYRWSDGIAVIPAALLGA